MSWGRSGLRFREWGHFVGYKVLQDRFWIEPVTRHLKPMEKLLLLNLRSHPHSHYSGIYHVTKQSISTYTGLSLDEVQVLLDTLSIPYRYPIDRVSGTFQEEKPPNRVFEGFRDEIVDNLKKQFFLQYDDIYEIVFVVDMLTDQTDGKLNQNQLKGVARHLAGLPRSSLIGRFLDYYAVYGIKKFLPERYPIPGFSKNGNNNNNNSSISKCSNSNSEAANSAAVLLQITDELIKPLRQAVNDLTGLDFNSSQYLLIAHRQGILIRDSVSVLISMAKTYKSSETINNPWGYVTNALKNINAAYKLSEALKEHKQNNEEEMKITSDILEYILTYEPKE